MVATRKVERGYNTLPTIGEVLGSDNLEYLNRSAH